MATGLNFKDPQTGQWTPSEEEIDILPDGTAVANQGQHTVLFPADIAQGVIELTTPDGMHLKSRPLGIFFDDGSRTVLIAALTNAVGYLAGSNQVIYPDAFTGVKGDLVMTYRKNGFESDVVLREQPPAPDQFGLSQNARLQLLTEFFNPPEPVQQPSAASKADGLTDTTLQFGSSLMKQGKAFAIGTPAAGPRTPVYKSWLHLNGRTFLVEEVPYRRISAQLQALPMPASSAAAISLLPSSASHLYEVSATRLLPPASVSKSEIGNRNSEMIRPLAKADLQKTPGLVLDYNQIDYDQTDITFQSGVTYYVSSQINLFGTTTFEGGSVIKFDEQNGGLQIFSAINNQSDPSHPTVLTSVNDDSVGNIITPYSSGQPGQVLTDPMDVYTNYIELKNFRFNHANFAFFNYMDASTNIFWNCEFSDCGETIDLTYGKVMLRNVLNFGVNFYGAAMNGNADPGEWYWLDAQNVTSSGGFVAYPDAAEQITLVVTNSILVGAGDELSSIAAMVGITYAHNTYGAADVATSADFESAGNANYYLAANSTLHDAGTTNIDPDLLAEFQTMTTYAPQDGSYPDTNTPDLGYHYPVNEDSDYDGLPDWWEWKYFGNFNHTGSELDANGNTLLSDYQNVMDPNIISFTVRLGNQHFNMTNATGNYLLLTGDPSYEAVLVNNTNLDDVVWSNYDGIIRMNLGLTDGVYQVWIGLKGHAPDALPTWVGTEVTLTRTAPEIFLTTPATNLLAQPYLQVQGFSTLPLAGICYDVSNAVAVVTNQLGSIVGHFLDTNTSSYTTDYFQCYDILLTNGLNTITLHATDPAGNVTVTNLYVTLDYTTAANPMIQLTWPQPAMEICQNSFTLRGWTEDATAAVVAQITDTNGDTDIVTGMVERTGALWVENLPLNAGTNFVALWVTNAAGLSSVTNFSVVQSGMTFTLTTIDGDLWSPTVNVGGAISDPTYSVWVNGVQGTNNGDGTWSAANVPVTAGGVASFDFKAVAPGGGDPEGNLNTTKASGIRLESDSWDYVQMMAADSLHWKGNLDWNAQKGGKEHDEFHPGDVDWDINDDKIGTDGYILADHYTSSDGTDTYLDNHVPADMPLAWGSLSGVDFLPLPVGALLWSSSTRTDKAKMMLHTGGIGVAGQKILVAISVTASETLNAAPWSRDVAPTEITIPQLGRLGSDGWVYGTATSGDTLDVTPIVSAPYYTYTKPNGGAYALISRCSCPLKNLARTTVGVGEVVSLYFSPSPYSATDPSPAAAILSVPISWTTTAGSVSPSVSYCGTVLTSPSSANTATVTATVRGASVSKDFSVIEPSGINATRRGLESFPVGQVGAGMYLDVVLQPTTVSFGWVQIEEPGANATDLQGYFSYPQNAPPNHDTAHGANKWHPVYCDNLVVDGVFDLADSYGWPIGQGGSYTWPIHPLWRVGSESTTHSLSGWTDQVMTLSADGTMRVDKLGCYVTRPPN